MDGDGRREVASTTCNKVLDDRMVALGAVNIVGTKGCGKTHAASERCATIIEFQDDERRDGYLAVADLRRRCSWTTNDPPCSTSGGVRLRSGVLSVRRVTTILIPLVNGELGI